MQNSTIKLMLTKLGKKKIASLLEKKEKAFVEIALGDQYKAFDELDAKLANECVRMTATILFTEDGIDRIHIQASLNNDNLEFNLHEIGLFLKDKENNSTLVGIYRTKQTLVSKSAKLDLFLDITLQLQDYNPKEFIINLPDYQPIFHISPASSEKLGAVRLATQKEIQQETDERALTTKNLATEAIINNATAGFVLTTNHLAALSSYKRNKSGEWISIKLNEKIASTKKAIQEISFVGSFFMESENAVYMLYATQLVRQEEEAQQIFLVKYDLQTHTVTQREVSRSFNRISSFVFLPKSPCYELDGNTINFYFLLNNFGNNQMCRLNISKLDNKAEIGETSLTGVVNFLNGSIFLYDRKIGSIAEGKINLLATDKFSHKGASTTITLEPDFQEDPLVHAIQDRLYCIGGNKSLVKVYNLHNTDTKRVSAFTPASTSALDLSNTEGLTSALLENYIYIFKPDTYFKGMSQPYNFYRYHILNNQWQSLPFPEKSLLPKKSEVNLGSAITVVNEIYLFFYR